MSESKYTSAVRQIPAPVEVVYPALSILQNLERVREHIPQDRIQDLEITPDSVRMKVELADRKSVV